MTMNYSQVYLVIDGQDALGYELVKEISKRKGVAVFAGIPNDPTTSSTKNRLSSLGPNVHPIHIVFGDIENNTSAIDLVRQTAGRLDVIIINTGSSDTMYKAIYCTEGSTDLELDTLPSAVLFQAAWPLMKQDNESRSPKFIICLSGLGDKYSNPAAEMRYSICKASLNFLIRKLLDENLNLVAFLLSTNWSHSANELELEQLDETKGKSQKLGLAVRNILRNINTSTREMCSRESLRGVNSRWPL